MSSLNALTVVHITGVSSFTAAPGFFYRVTTSGGNVAANLPAVASTDQNSWLIIKNLDGTNVVNVNPHGSELINDSNTQHTVSGSNQSLQYMPNTPSSYAAGWVSW